MVIKEVSIFAASLVAASSAALAAADTDNFASIPKFPCSVHKGLGSRSESESESASSAKMPSSESRRKKDVEDKFAPRFDGLRFIETLVTAHR